MAYRDEMESLRARVKALEEDLAAAHGTIARLERTPPADPSLAGTLLGAPTEIKVEREVTVTLDESTIEDVVDALAEGFGCEGSLSRVGKRLVWTAMGGNRMLDVTLVERDGQVRVRMRERTGGLAGGVFGGVGGGVGGGFAWAVAMGATALGVPIAVAIPAWLLLAMLLARVVFTRLVGRRERQLHRAMTLVERVLGRATAKARIATSPSPLKDEAEDEAEIEAAEAEEKAGQPGSR